MGKITKSRVDSQVDDLEQDGIKTLTPEEAAEVKKKLRSLSVWKVVAYQVLVGAILVLLSMWITGNLAVAVSVGYGALSVIVPAAVFARGMSRQVSSVNAGAAVFGFLFWELIKIGLTLVMLTASNGWVKDLSWPAMLVGLVVTMKVYWIALGFNSVFYSKIKLT